MLPLNSPSSGGTNQDPVKKNGLVYLLSGLLDEGAGELTSKEFQKKLNENSISMSFNASRDHFDGSMVTLTETLDTALDLLALAINNPVLTLSQLAGLKIKSLLVFAQSKRNQMV